MKNINSLKNKLTLVILGRSGSGKGTQARFILQKLGRKNSHHMETGRFLREFIKKENPTALLARRLMARGINFPYWFPVYAWLKELLEKGAIDKHLVFDGAPRRILEAKVLDDVMGWHSRSLPLCIYVDVSTEEAVKRLLARGRADDIPASIRNRLKYFVKDVKPVIEYYQKRGRLLCVDGNPVEEEVHKAIDLVLAKRLGKRWPR